MYRTVNISLPGDLIDEIDDILENWTREYRSRSHFLQVAIIDYIDRTFEPEEGEDDED